MAELPLMGLPIKQQNFLKSKRPYYINNNNNKFIVWTKYWHKYCQIRKMKAQKRIEKPTENSEKK